MKVIAGVFKPTEGTIEKQGVLDVYKRQGTTGQSKRIEAICMHLTGDITAYYDIYYRCLLYTSRCV